MRSEPTRQSVAGPSGRLGDSFRRDLLPPILLGLAIIAMAPFWGSVALPALEERLGRAGLRAGLTVGVFVAGVLVVGYALRRIRQRRLQRFGLLALAITLVLVQAMTTGRDEAAVERVHFVMYGLVALLLVRALAPRRGWWALPMAMVAAATVGIVDEWVQWLVPVRVGDIFDVGLNLYASACGSLIGVALYPPRAEGRLLARRAAREFAAQAVAFSLAVAAFLQCAHLGHEIVDPQVGRFRSFFTRAELEVLNQDRAVRWGGVVPPPLAALQVEDYFRTEAAWHVLQRNRARNSGEFEIAWREDRILALYYPTFRELRRRDGEPHYLIPEAELRELAQRFPTADPNYRSTADNGRIWVWPSPVLLWGLTGLIALAAAWLSRTPRLGA